MKRRHTQTEHSEPIRRISKNRWEDYIHEGLKKTWENVELEAVHSVSHVIENVSIPFRIFQ